MISFEYLNKPEFEKYSQPIFDILADNMTVIAPTGNSRAKDFELWSEAVSGSLERAERQIILIKDNEVLIGFFQYNVNENIFLMEEIQFKPEYHGKGIFRELYSFVFSNLKDGLVYVEAYASVNNKKSIGILEKLGLSNVGLNKNGRSYHFKGSFNDLIKWFERE